MLEVFRYNPAGRVHIISGYTDDDRIETECDRKLGAWTGDIVQVTWPDGKIGHSLQADKANNELRVIFPAEFGKADRRAIRETEPNDWTYVIPRYDRLYEPVPPEKLCPTCFPDADVDQ